MGRGSILECCVLPVATVTILLSPGWALVSLGFLGTHRGEDLVAPIRKRAQTEEAVETLQEANCMERDLAVWHQEVLGSNPNSIYQMGSISEDCLCSEPQFPCL